MSSSSIYTNELAGGRKSYTLMWRDQNGRQHKRTFERRWMAVEHRDKVLPAVADGSFKKVVGVPMEEVFKLFLEHLERRVRRGEMKASTFAGYRSACRQFAEVFRPYRSNLLDAETVVKVWDNPAVARLDCVNPATGKSEAGTMARKTYNNQLNQLSAVFKWARGEGYLACDPLATIKRLTLEKKEADFLEDEDIAALLAAVAGDAEAAAVVHLGLFAGLRRGEIFALRWRDVEFENRRLRVRKAVSLGRVGEPKTANSVRDVDVPLVLLEVLERQRAAHPPVGAGYVLRTERGGGHYDPTNWYKRRFAKVRAAAGLRPSVGLHSLRHTYASLLIRQGENIKFVSRQLGHASVSFTLDVYGHLFRSTGEAAMGRLDETIRAANRQRFALLDGGER